MFVNLMLLDFVKIREYGFNDANDTGRICEACKSEEKAVANCIHCCSDLCPKCVQVHRDMKMFDGHKVRKLIVKGGGRVRSTELCDFTLTGKNKPLIVN